MAAATGIPRRTLVALSFAVLLAHLFALQAAPSFLQAPDLATTRAWTTRTIVLNPVPALAEAVRAVAAPTPVPVPTPVRPRTPRAAQAQPTSTASASGEQAPTPTQVAQASPAASEAAAPAAPPAMPAASAPDASATATTATAAQPAPASPAAPAAPPASIRETSPSPTVAFTVPGSVRLKFNVIGQVRQQNYEARGELLWLHDGSSYDARMEVSVFPFGSRVQTSSGRIGAQGLAPTRFADRSRNEVAAHFDRNNGRVTFSNNAPEAPLLSGAQDRLSVLLQLASMVAGDPARFAAGTTVSVQTIGPRDADVWLFTVEGEEKIRVADAEQTTLKLTRKPRREFDQKVDAWLAPQLGYLPVRIRIAQPNGDYVDQQLRTVEKP